MSTIHILGIPMDLGQTRRGVDMGPSAVRYAGLHERLSKLGHVVVDDGNIEVSQVEQIAASAKKKQSVPVEKARFLPEISHVCQAIYEHVVGNYANDDRVIFLGGDHSISIGTVAGIAKLEEVGVLWIDAHADINSPRTTPSGNIHGMSVATLLGDGPAELVNIGYEGAKIRPEQLVMIGQRDLDVGEQEKLRRDGIDLFTMRQVDELGMAAVIRLALERLNQYKHLHISFDLDSLEPEVAPGVGTPVPGGLSYREAHLLMEILADSGKVRSMDIVEVNPILDKMNVTGQIAVGLAASLFGQRII